MIHRPNISVSAIQKTSTDIVFSVLDLKGSHVYSICYISKLYKPIHVGITT